MTDTTTTTAPLWHAGVEAETLGFWQNKGLDLSDPKNFAVALTKQYRNAESLIGGPPDQLLKLPKADAKPEDLRAFYTRLGAPAEAKDYDFSAVKDAADQPIAAPLADALRATAFARGLSKDAATAVAQSVVKTLDGVKAAETATLAAKIAGEKATLAQNWGAKFDFNRLQAMEGAARLGITQEAVALMEKQLGYAAVMEAMRKIGAGTTEDTFIDRGARGGTGNPVTREGAVARKAELMADTAWGERWIKGGAAEKMEMDGLNFMIDGESKAA